MELKPVEGKEDRYELGKGTQLQKTKLGEWRIIRPLVVNKRFNWPNFLYGGKVTNIFVVVILIGLLLFGTWAYERDIRECKYLIENPPRCEFIPKASMIINYTNITLMLGDLDKKELEDDNELDTFVFTQDNDKSN